MSILADPDATARSLMNKAPCICDGEKTGIPCRHFWSLIQKFPAANADTMRRGENQRACTLETGWPLEFVSEEKPAYCNRYTPRKEEGLFALVQRAVFGALLLGPSRARLEGREIVPRGGEPLDADGFLGPDPAFDVLGWAKYDRYFNEFRPMTAQEIEELRKKYPDEPHRWQQGKNPLNMSISDIANAEPVGMLKPGEKLPGTLSSDTDKMLDDIFDSGKEDGIFKK